MTSSRLGRVVLGMAGAALAFGIAACDPNQEQKEVLAHNAKLEKAEADEKVQRQAGRATECLSALRWKRGVLAGAGVGSVDVYLKHYRAQLEKLLGDTTIPAADGAPELSKANIDPYLEWAYTNDVKTKFTSGRDFDKDGTVTRKEANAQGNSRVVACIQQAAEMNVGPLQGRDLTGRMFKMEALRARLDKSS
jgi:hypothetical protein